MSRFGQFNGPSEVYGDPVAVVKPVDNNVAGSKYNRMLMDPTMHLTNTERDDLQRQIEELFALLRLARDLGR